MLRSWKLHPTPIIILSQLSFLIISVLFEKTVVASLSATPLTLECLVSLAPASVCLRFKALLSSLPIDFSQPLTTFVLSRKRNTVVIRQAHVHFKCLAMLPTHTVWLKRHLKWPKTTSMTSQNSYFTCMKASSRCFLLIFNSDLPTRGMATAGRLRSPFGCSWQGLPLRKTQLLKCYCRACVVGPRHVILCLRKLPWALVVNCCSGNLTELATKQCGIMGQKSDSERPLAPSTTWQQFPLNMYLPGPFSSSRVWASPSRSLAPVTRKFFLSHQSHTKHKPVCLLCPVFRSSSAHSGSRHIAGLGRGVHCVISPNTEKAEAGGLLDVWDQLGYIVSGVLESEWDPVSKLNKENTFLLFFPTPQREEISIPTPPAHHRGKSSQFLPLRPTTGGNLNPHPSVVPMGGKSQFSISLVKYSLDTTDYICFLSTLLLYGLRGLCWSKEQSL